MDLKDIKLIIDLMKKNDLSVFQMEKEGFKILLKKGQSGGYAVGGAPAAAPVFHTPPMPQQAAPAPAMETAAAAPAPAPKGREITSLDGRHLLRGHVAGTRRLTSRSDRTVTADETVVCIHRSDEGHERDQVRGLGRRRRGSGRKRQAGPVSASHCSACKPEPPAAHIPLLHVR